MSRISTSFHFMPLSYFLSSHGEDVTQRMLDSFEPYIKSSTDDFLKRNAIAMEKRDLSRTFLALSDDMRLLGFVTLGMKCMRVPAENLLSNKCLRLMNIESRTGVAQAYLLGQIARSKDSPKGMGSELLEYATSKLRACKSSIGCNLVRLDCEDSMVPYYMQHNFRLFREDGEDGMNQMVAFL